MESSETDLSMKELAELADMYIKIFTKITF